MEVPLILQTFLDDICLEGKYYNVNSAVVDSRIQNLYDEILRYNVTKNIDKVILRS